MNYAIILAAGKGTRMKTELSQCAYPLIRKPMVAYVVENVLDFFDEVIVVVGYKRDTIRDILGIASVMWSRKNNWEPGTLCLPRKGWSRILKGIP